MGLATILDARRVLVVAFGENKAAVARRAVEGSISEDCAASFLQEHNDCTMVLDAAAAAGNSRTLYRPPRIHFKLLN